MKLTSKTRHPLTTIQVGMKNKW